MKDSHPGIYIGTSGLVLPINKGNFPAEFKSGTRLQYYSSLFNSLEVNSSFYKTPRPQTFAKWQDEANDDFSFTVKLSGAITHAKRLEYDPHDLTDFMNAVNHLDSKKGALLIQFPASVTINYYEKVEEIIKHIQSLQQTSKWHLAVEVRNPGWYNSAVYEMLITNKASLVFHDMPNSRTPLEQAATDIIYLRLHGPTGNYRDGYNASDLETYAAWIYQWHLSGKTIYIYFNNTIGDAYDNALSLRGCIGQLIGQHREAS